MNIETLPIDAVKEYDRNPRKNEEAVGPVAESIRQFGFKIPVLVDADGVLIAGHKSAITFASQFTKTETVRNPSDFGDLVRGLQVYGMKVVKPEALAIAVVY